MKLKQHNTIYLRNFSFIIILIASFLFSSCAQRIKSKYGAKNIKKLNRVYIVFENGLQTEYDTEEEWKENTSTVNPVGYSVLKNKNDLFTGKVIRFYRKGIFKIPTAYVLFEYKNGFIDGKYSYNLMNETVLIEGEAKPSKVPDWEYINHFDSPIFNGGLGLRELDRSRKEYVIREKIYKNEKKLVSHYVRDSIYFYIQEYHDPSIETWEEVNYELNGKFKYNLRTDQKGDTLFYEFNSDTLDLIIEKEIYKPNHKYYCNKSQYTDDENIEEWSNISGYIYRKNKKIEITTTLEGNTIEIANLSNGKYHGSLLKFTPTGDTIEKIYFKDGMLDGAWIKYDSKGDTLHFRNFVNGRKFGKWIGSPSSELKTEFRGGFYDVYEANYNENGLLDGLVKIYWKYPNEKKLTYECMMKNGLKNGYFIQYNNRKELSGKVESRTEYLNGVKHGEHESYYPREGTLREKGRYENDKMSGKWIYYRDFEKGIIDTEGEYLNGEMFGEWIYYNSDGTINRKVKY